MTLDISDVVKDVTDEVATYFRSLGFDVTWDFQRRTGLHWYEICEDGKLLVQIDYGAPLADLKEDLPKLARDGASTCASTWEVRGPIENLRRVVARMVVA